MVPATLLNALSARSMDIQPSIVDRVGDVAIVQVLLIRTASASFKKRERHQHVRPVMGITRPGIVAAQSEESNGKEPVRLMPIDHADSIVSQRDHSLLGLLVKSDNIVTAH